MTTEFSLGMFGRKQERDLRQTATEELLSCSLKFSYALVSFLICTLQGASKLEGFTRRNRKGNKEREGFHAERAGLQPKGNRELLRWMATVPASLAFCSHPSAQEKQDLAEWHRCPLLV